MELYLIRHGQTDWNKEGRLQGSVDIELNENGRAMAKAAGIRLNEVFFDKIYSSPLKRAYETAELIRNNRNLEIIVDESLREISFGAMEGTTYDDLSKEDSPCKYFFAKFNKFSSFKQIE